MKAQIVGAQTGHHLWQTVATGNSKKYRPDRFQGILCPSASVAVAVEILLPRINLGAVVPGFGPREVVKVAGTCRPDGKGETQVKTPQGLEAPCGTGGRGNESPRLEFSPWVAQWRSRRSSGTYHRPL